MKEYYIYSFLFVLYCLLNLSNANNINLVESFSEVYRKRKWGNEGGGSGGGSTMQNTHNLRIFLNHYIINNNITSFSDCPCGSMEWMPLVILIIFKK